MSKNTSNKKTTKKSTQNSPKNSHTILIVSLVLVAVIILCTFLGPLLVLELVRQHEPEDHEYKDSFFYDYYEVRANLEKRITSLENSGITVVHTEYAIDESDDLYIDNVLIPATEENTNLLVLTTGVHGIEGYIGSVMLDVFFEEIFPSLDRSNTGVLVVANINPYGMKYMRRYNENNVDLNRNFIEDWDSFDRSLNEDYPKVLELLQPEGAIINGFWHEVRFYVELAQEAIFTGASTISDALLTGQYEYPEGVYYGGNGDEASTAYLKNVFAECLDSQYENIVHVDIHSGYGPRYNMVIFNSVQDTTSEADSKAELGYDYIIAQDSEEFYITYGDTTDYFYRLANSKNNGKSLYSTCFEFGTLGDGFFDSILSLKYTVDENRNNRFPTNDKTVAEIIRNNYLELFYPAEAEWRLKAISDFT